MYYGGHRKGHPDTVLLREARLPEKIIFSTKSIGRMEQIFENKKLNVTVRTVGKGDEVLFYAKDAAIALDTKTQEKPLEITYGTKTGCR